MAGDSAGADRAEGTGARLPVWKLALFGAGVTVAFLLLLEGALALAGVRPAWYQGDPLAGFAARIPHFVEEEGEDGSRVVTVARGKRDEMNRHQRFPAAKAPGTRRVFCLGGSTTYGHPFFDATSFCGWLRAFLPAAAPAHAWEVVNAGALSYASYRITGVLRELLAYEPDLFVVYTGQNEFLERRTYEKILARPGFVNEVLALVNRTRIATLLRAALGLDPRADAAPKAEGETDGAPGDPAEDLGLDEEVRVARFDAVGPEAFTREDPPRDLVVAYFRQALHGMVDLAAGAGAELLLVSPASNLSDFSPFKSEAAELAPRARARFEAHLQRGRERLEAGDPEAALEALSAAVALDARHAELRFLEGRALLALGRNAAARAAFERALEEDVVPFRATAAIRRTLREVAEERGVPLVDFDALLTAASANGIPGEEHFFDHVHPTIDAHRLLALAIVERLAETGFVSLADDWGPQAIEAISARVRSGIDRERHASQLRKLSAMLELVGQPEQSRKQALAAIELSGGDPEAAYQAGVVLLRQGKAAEAEPHLREAAAAMPDNPWPPAQIGVALAARGRDGEARAALERALALDPELAFAHAHLGLLLMRAREPEAAVPHLEEVVRLEPASADAHANLGIAYARLRRDEEAREHLQRAVAQSPGNAQARYALGVVLERAGQREQAIEAYRAVLRADPNHPVAARRLRALE